MGADFNGPFAVALADGKFLQARTWGAHQHQIRDPLVGLQPHHAPAVDDITCTQAIRVPASRAETGPAEVPVEGAPEPPEESADALRARQPDAGWVGCSSRLEPVRAQHY